MGSSILFDVTRSSFIVGGTIVVALSLIGLWALSARPPAEERAPIDYVEDTATIAAMVELDRLGILTAENFVGNRIRVIEGTLRNAGDRAARSVELRLEFHGVDGEVVYEDTREALRSTLVPGETRRYEFRYEDLPDTWNYRIPAVTVNRVGF